MKRIFLITTLLSTLISFSQDEKTIENIIISGQIDNPETSTIKILGKHYEEVDSLELDENNEFRDTLQLSEGFYLLKIGEKSAGIYLKPNTDIGVTLDTENLDETVKFTGEGSKENNFMLKKALYDKKFSELNSYGHYGRLEEKEFILLSDSLNELKTKFLSDAEGLDKNFTYLMSKIIEFENLQRLAGYEQIYAYFTDNKDYKVSKDFPNPFENIDLTDSKMLVIPNYLPYAQSYIVENTPQKGQNDNEDYDNSLAYIKTVNELVMNQEIKEELLYLLIKRNFNNTKKLDEVNNEIGSILTNEKYLTALSEKYNKLKLSEKGAVSPPFELNDINGNLISLDDLKGKLVYVDVWATWCSPCLKEIPSLKKMDEHFEGEEIAFVSICISDKEERWRKMVNEKELGGIQLFAPDSKISFIQDYSIRGIPRFILIDKEGKIIDGNAKRPSNPDLQIEIERYLKD